MAVCIPSKDRCLAHVNDDDRESYFSTLTPGQDVDLRRVTFEESLWERVVKVFSSERETVRFGELRLEEAIFRYDVDLSDTQFCEQASVSYGSRK